MHGNICPDFDRPNPSHPIHPLDNHQKVAFLRIPPDEAPYINLSAYILILELEVLIHLLVYSLVPKTHFLQLAHIHVAFLKHAYIHL